MPLRMIYMCTSRFYRHPKPLLTLFFLCMGVIVVGLLKLFPRTAKVKYSMDYQGQMSRIQGSVLISGNLPPEVNNPPVTPTSKCILPDLDVNHKGMMEYTKDLGKLECGKEKFGYLTGGKLHVKGNGVGNVEYEPIQERTSTGEEDAPRFQLGQKVELHKSEVIQKLAKGKSGSIQHARGRCIQPSIGTPEDGTPVILFQGCGTEGSQFEFTEEGYLRHKTSKKCIRTRAGLLRAGKNTELVMNSICDEAAKFETSPYNTIKHVSSGLCIHDRDGDSDPPDYAPLVLRFWCDKEFLRYTWFNSKLSGSGGVVDLTNDIQHDFIKLSVSFPARPESSRYAVQHLLQAHPSEDTLKRGEGHERHYDVLFIMFRSLSSAHFQRKMPETFKFLTNEMKAVVFNGFSTVGESVLSQVLPMFAGVPLNTETAKSMDNLPWVFKSFKEHGYVTMVTEDSASENYKDNLRGFQQRQVDHFAEPFWASAARSLQDPGNHHVCFGAESVHNLTLTYMESFFNNYGTNKNKFGLVINSEMSIMNPVNYIGYMDQDLVRTLQKLKESKALERTFLFISSNHGLTTTRFRDTLQGKLEERSPLLMVSIPKELTNYEDTYQNLVDNKNMLVTPYNVHTTLRQISNGMKVPEDVKAGSLLSKLDSKQQNCASAGVPKVWCPCLSAKVLAAEGVYVQNIAQYVIEMMNTRLSNSDFTNQKCKRVELGKIISIEKLTPNDLVMSFKYSRSKGECLQCEPVVGKTSSSKLADDLLYRIQVVLKSGSNVYESQVNIRNGQILSSSDARLVSGEPKDCSVDSAANPSLRDLCVC